MPQRLSDPLLLVGRFFDSITIPKDSSLSQPASVTKTKDIEISMDRIQAKSGHSLYWSITKWISITFIVCSSIEYIISERISNRIDSIALQAQASEVLNDYSSNLRARWEDLKTNDLNDSVRHERLKELINDAYTSQHILPVIVSDEKIIMPNKSEQTIDPERIKLIIDELVIDDDKYIINLGEREPALAAATKKLLIDDQEDIQPNLVLIMKWPLLQNLRELEREALKLKGFTLIIVIITSSILMFILLKPLRRLNEKTSNLSSETLMDGHLDTNGVPLEIKELIDSYNSALARLDQEYKDQQLFASNVSHEFKTPLTVINGFIDSVLLREENLSEKNRIKLQTAQRETLRINQLVNDLLDLSRYDHNLLLLENKPFKPSQAISEVWETLKTTYHERIHLELDSPNKDKYALGDKGRYFQIIQNLCENAIKYSPQKDKVTIKTYTSGNQFITEVNDQGPGIPDELKDKIFERFFRVDQYRSLTKKPSSGLGLSIVKSLAESMDARVGVRSNDGNGSSFWISIGIIDEDKFL